MTLSVRCFSNGPLGRTATVLSFFRSVADEILCAVDCRFSDDDVAVLRDVCDRVVRCEMRTDFSSINPKAWLMSYECAHDWVLAIDHDEVPSPALIDALPHLTAAGDVSSYFLERRWLFPDARQFIDEYPWRPDWLVRLIRNDPATRSFGSRVHEAVLPSEPYRYLDAHLYHLDLVTSPYSRRAAKVARYQSFGDKPLEDGRSMNETYYLPEQSPAVRTIPVPPEDQPSVDLAISSAYRSRDSLAPLNPDERPTLPRGTITHEEMAQAWPGRAFRDDDYLAPVTVRDLGRQPRRDPGVFEPGERRALTAVVRNESDELWLSHGREPRVTLSARWLDMSQDLHPVVAEAYRFPFHANVAPRTEVVQPFEVIAPERPGQYELRVGVVHEFIRWFDGDEARVVTVRERPDGDPPS